MQGVRRMFAWSARRGPIYRARGWGGRHMRMFAPFHPVGAINRAPTTCHRFARLPVSAQIVRAPKHPSQGENLYSQETDGMLIS